MSRCPGCPIAGEGDSPCEPARDWPGWCGRIAGEAHQPDGARYWSRKIFDEADKLSKSGPATRRTPFPAAHDPRDPRIRVGAISPSCYLGGADIWVGDLLKWPDKSRVHWVGAAVRDNHIAIIPEVRASWEEHCPVAVGPDAIRALARGVDVLVAWGVFHNWGYPAAALAPLVGNTKLVYVSHGSMGDSLVPSDGLLMDAVPVGVSLASLKGMPPEFRERATIIPNAIDPGRVRTTKTRDAMLAELGLPAGAKVAGYLGRFAGEKRPRVLIDAVPHLPDGWFAVMAGIGYSLEADMAHAWDIAPGRIKFLGGRHDVGDLLSLFDCLVMPSQTEACSLSANEAFMAGCPLISTAVGMMEEADHPEFARIIPNPPSGADAAAAILADDADPVGTRARVDLARTFARTEMPPGEFGRKWTELLVEVGEEVRRAKVGKPVEVGRPSSSAPVTVGSRAIVDPAVRDAVSRCPHRGPEGGLTLLPDEASCCGGGEERTACSAGLGSRPGRPTLRDCLRCAGERLASSH